MAGNLMWNGASGKRYPFTVFPRHPTLPSGAKGNYIYAKTIGNTWYAVYIGQGDVSVRATGDHHRIACINSKGATHVHIYPNDSERDRLAVEKDLLAAHGEAYTPTGCNVREGG